MRPGFIIEFDVIELEGKEYAQLICQAEIEYPELSNEIVQDIIAEVDAIIEQKGFLTAIEFSQLLKGNGIQDVKTYAKNMTGFISKYLVPKYTSRSNVRVNGKICPCAIVSAEASANLSFGESSMSSRGLDDDTMRKVISVLTQHIREHGYMLSSELPTIFKRFGLDNYKLYADSLAQFVEKYLTDFVSKTHAYIGGKDYPAIIIESGQEISFFSSDDASVLTPLYESGDYYGFLSSEHFTKYRPIDIPPFFFTKALTCAKRLLTKDEEAVFTLNSFQETLLEAPLGTTVSENCSANLGEDWIC